MPTAALYIGLTDQTQQFPAKPADIRAIYDRVVAGELDESKQPDGELFRKVGVDIIASSQKTVHQGVIPESAIIEMLSKMITMTENENIPAIYRAIISHFVFEYVHPFYDGNGRTGRYLLALYLTESLSLPTVLSLSRTIAENKAKYYRTFQELEATLNHAEATLPIIGMMELIRSAQDYLMDDLETKQSILFGLNEYIEGLGSLSPGAKNLLHSASQLELFTSFESESIHELARHAKISLLTARKYSKELDAAGLLSEKSRRPLLFALTDKARTSLGLSVG
ncbi:MAG: Fic family protein [Coriobacteriales bacterium]|jgi:Fic family protein|nr:Fic family protein [Coriobacteriales bacterium]